MKAVAIISLFLLTLKISAQDTNNLLNRGNQYYQTAQYEMAETEYRKATAGNPRNIIAQFNLANALQKQKKFDEAIQVLQKLAPTVNNPGFRSAVYYNEGVAYSSTKQLEQSIEAYKNALRYNSSDQEARENLQKALLELKKQQQQKKNQDKQSQQPKMNQKEAEQKLRLLEQKERDLQQRLQNQNKQSGSGQKEDW